MCVSKCYKLSKAQGGTNDPRENVYLPQTKMRLRAQMVKHLGGFNVMEKMMQFDVMCTQLSLSITTIPRCSRPMNIG